MNINARKSELSWQNSGSRHLRLSALIACVTLAGFFTPFDRSANGCPVVPTRALSTTRDLSIEALGELISIHRLRWPAFEVAYTHDLIAGVERTGGAGASATGTVWFYANASPASPRATVRSILETPAPTGLGEQPHDSVIWMFDSETGTATYADMAGKLARVSHNQRVLEGNREFECFTGIAAMRSLSVSAPSQLDLLTAIRDGVASLRPELVQRGGYECLAVDVPIDLDAGLADRHTYYVCEALNYALVALEVVVADRVWSRRVGSEFIELAPGAPYLPLAGSLWCQGDGTNEIHQEIRVVRRADGAPEIRSGDGVAFNLHLEPGTRVEDLDSGVVRVVSADWSDQSLAALGDPLSSVRTASGFTIVSLSAASIVTLGALSLVARRRREAQVRAATVE